MVLKYLRVDNSSVFFFLLGVFLTAAIALGVPSEELSRSADIPYSSASPELMSPADHVSEKDIHVYSKRIVIDGEYEWAKFTDTNSMDPLLDVGTNAIQKVPQSESDISIGDIVTYERDGEFIIHRVIGISEDDKGIFYTLKGDNNRNPDPYKVRFDDVRKVLVGILY